MNRSVPLLMLAGCFFISSYFTKTTWAAALDAEDLPAEVSPVNMSEEDLAELASLDKENQGGWAATEKEILADLLALHDGTLKRGQEIYERNYEEFLEALDREKIRFDPTDLPGRGQMTLIEGEPIIRLVHAPTQMSYILLQEEQIRLVDTKHFKSYLGRQHIEAGEHMEGRNVRVMWLRSQDLARHGEMPSSVLSKSYPRHPFFSKDPGNWFRWSRDWARARFNKKPAADSVRLAVFCTAEQLAVTGCLNWIGHEVNGSGFHPAPYILNTVFGMTLGIYNSPYRSWLRAGIGHKKWHGLVRWTKNMSISGLFAYSLHFMSGNSIDSISILTGAGLLANAHLLSNMGLNNIAKTSLGGIPVEREKMRIGAKRYKNWWTLGLEFPGASFFGQQFYMISNTFRLSDLMLTGLTINLFGMGEVTYGKLLLVAGIFGGNYLSMKYAEKIKSPNAAHYRDRWDLWTGQKAVRFLEKKYSISDRFRLAGDGMFAAMGGEKFELPSCNGAFETMGDVPSVSE